MCWAVIQRLRFTCRSFPEPTIEVRRHRVAVVAGLDGYHYVIATFARALLVTVTAPDKAYAFDEARHQLAQAARTVEPVDHDPALRKTYRRVMRQIAPNCGGLRHKLWALWRVWHPLLPPVKPVT